MTRRIALAILVTAWAALALGSATAYVVTRQTLLAELDASIVARAMALPEALGGEAAGTVGADVALPAGDRYVVRNDVGRTLARPAPAARPGAPAASVVSRAFAEVPGGGRLRTLTLAVAAPPAGADGAAGPARPLTIVYSSPADSFDRLLTRLAGVLAGATTAAAALAALAALLIGRSALRPLRAVADAVGTIDESRLDRRVDAAALPPELAPVAERLNAMLERLERAFAQRRQFLADAAHELRTPVAALLTGLEVTLRRQRSPEELADALRDCLADARVLRRLVDALMRQARAESPAIAGAADADAKPEDADVAALLDECCAVLGPQAAAREVRIERRYEKPLPFRTEPWRLQSIAANLLANAVEYNRPGGAVTVECRRREADGGLDLVVRDTGPGIAAEHLPQIFEPFYRAAAAAAQPASDAHLGLGLCLVRTHVAALGGRCDVRSDGSGTEFRVSFPAAAAAPAAPPASPCATTNSPPPPSPRPPSQSVPASSSSSHLPLVE